MVAIVVTNFEVISRPSIFPIRLGLTGRPTYTILSLFFLFRAPTANLRDFSNELIVAIDTPPHHARELLSAVLPLCNTQHQSARSARKGHSQR